MKMVKGQAVNYYCDTSYCWSMKLSISCLKTADKYGRYYSESWSERIRISSKCYGSNNYSYLNSYTAETCSLLNNSYY